MNTRALLWAAAHAVLGLLSIASLDALLLKFTRPWAGWVPALLAAVFVAGLCIRTLAGRMGDAPLARRWRALDRYATAWALVLFVLLCIFHASFVRTSGDGREYFSHLHSIVIDRDLDFANEIRDFGSNEPWTFPLGSAVLWLPFYLAAHGWLAVLNVFGAGFERNGYFYPYSMAVGLGTLAYGLLGLILIYRVAAGYFGRALSFGATLVVTGGSFIVWYLAVDNSYTHANSLFSVTLFLYLWHRSRGTRGLWQWAWLGLAGGLMVMVRWQNAVFLLPAALDLAWLAARAIVGRNVRGIRDTAAAGAVMALAFFAGMLPQMYFWRVSNGGWLTVPHGQAGQQWWHDSLVLDVLFSANHGLLAWHPVLYLSLLGVPLFLRRDWTLGLILTSIFLAQVYINGAVTTWWGGTAFGGRRFDGCALLFVLGLAALIRWCQQRPTAAIAAVLAVFSVVNAFFMRDAYLGRLPLGEGITVDRLLGSTISRLGNPFSFPANAIFAWRTGAGPADYDRLGLRLYNNIRIDVGSPDDAAFLLDGWSGPEDAGDWTFRWAVTNQSSIALPLMGPRYTPPGEPLQLPDYLLRIRAQPVRSPAARQTIAIDINGWTLAERHLEDGLVDYEFVVPSKRLHRNINLLRFRYGLTRSPREDGGDDDRHLAVRFDQIDLVQR